VEVLNQIVEKKKFKKFIENFEIAFSEKIEEIAFQIEEKAFYSRESPLIVFVYGAVCIGKHTVAERIRKVLENRGKKVKHYSIDRNTQEGFLLLKEGYRVGEINPKDLDILIVSGASLNEELVNSVAKKRRFSILCYLAPSLKLATKEPLVSVNLRLLRRLLEFKNKNKNPLDAIRLHIAERTCYIGIYPFWWREKDIAINCYNPCELPAFKKYAGEILRESHIKAKEENDTRSIKKIKHLLLILQDLRPLEKEDEAFIPQDSLIRQFLPSASSGIDTRKERLEIKEAEEKDLDIWFRKERKLSRLMWEIELEKISQFKEDTGRPVLVIFLKAIIDDEIVGLVLAYKDYIYLRAKSGEYFDEEAIRIALIEVDRDYYRSGIGRILIKEVERRGLGFPLWAQVWAEAEVRKSFFKWGFRQMAGDEWRKEASSSYINIRNFEAEIWRYPSLKKVMERLSKVPPGIGHIYNVDKHSLVAVKILDLTGEKTGEIKEEFSEFYKLWKEKDFRLLKEAYEEIKKEGYLWLLRLATLLHDIGKLTQEEAKSKEYKELLKLDHPERGAILAEPVLKELGLNEEEKNFIIWLIRNHNYLNYFASTYIYQTDELALLDLVNKVEPRKYHTLKLSSLYLLSWADRVAMNPEFPDIFGLYIHYERLSRWYKIAKIKIDELYKGKQTLEEWEENLRKKMHNLIISYYGDKREVQLYLNLLLKNELYEIDVTKISKEVVLQEINLIEEVLNNKVSGKIAIEVFKDEDRHFEKYYKIIVCLRPDRIGLLSDLAGVFWLHNLDIKEARIRTDNRKDVVLDTFYVRTEEKINLKRLKQALREDLRKVLIEGETIERLAKEYNKEISFLRKDKIFTQIKFGERKGLTILEIKTADREGLIYIIATVLKKLGINILKALISTYGLCVQDTFYITEDERPISLNSENKIREKLKILDKERIVFEDLGSIFPVLASSSLSQENIVEEIYKLLDKRNLSKIDISRIFSCWREEFPERKITPIEILFSFPSFLVKELNLPFINFPSQNTALLVIDVQNDFCQRGGEFAYGKREIEKNRDDLAPIQYMVNKNLIKLIEKTRQSNVNIVFVQAEYKENQFKDMPELCIKGSEGWEFYKIKPELEKGEKVFSKNKYDAFENQLLKEYLFSKNIKYILITGVTTDNCIKAAFDSNLVKVKRYVIGDCVSTAGYKLLTSHLTTLKYFKERNTLIWLSQISFSSSSPHTVSATPYSIKEELVQLIIGTRYQDEFIRLAQEEMTKFYKISSGSSCLSSFSRLLKRLKDNFENTKDKYKFADSVPYADKILILIVMTDSSFGEVLPTNCLRWAERFSTLLSGESIDKENREFVRKILKDIAYINIMKSKKGEFFWTEVKFKSNPEIFVFDRLPTFYSDYIKEYPYGYFGRLNSSNKKIAYFYKNSEFYIKVFPKYKEVEPQSLYLERMEKLLLRENISSPIASSIEKNVPINNFERRCSSCSFLDNYERKLTNKVSLAILPVYDNAGKRRKKFYQTFGFFPPEVRERTIYIKNRNFILQELVRFLLKNRYLNIGKIEILAPYYLDSRFLGKVKDLLSLARKIIKRRKFKTDLTLVITTTNIYERISEKASQLIGGAFIEENIAVLSICHLEADSIFSLSESINRNALHEIGHLLGLKHCQNRCVMSKLLNVFGYTEFCPVCQRELYKNFCRPDREYSAKREKNNKTSSTLRVRKRDLFQSVIDKLIQVYFKQRTPQNKKCVDGFCCFIKNEKSFPVKLVSFSSTDLDEVSGEDLILFAKQNYPCDKLGIFFDYKDNKLYILTKCTDYHKRPARCREYPESSIFIYS